MNERHQGSMHLQATTLDEAVEKAKKAIEEFVDLHKPVTLITRSTPVMQVNGYGISHIVTWDVDVEWYVP